MQNIFSIIASLMCLYGVVRLIFINTQDTRNVSLTSWMFFGGLIQLVQGLILGVVNLIRLRFDENARATLVFILGAFIFYLSTN